MIQPFFPFFGAGAGAGGTRFDPYQAQQMAAGTYGNITPKESPLAGFAKAFKNFGSFIGTPEGAQLMATMAGAVGKGQGPRGTDTLGGRVGEAFGGYLKGAQTAAGIESQKRLSGFPIAAQPGPTPTGGVLQGSSGSNLQYPAGYQPDQSRILAPGEPVPPPYNTGGGSPQSFTLAPQVKTNYSRIWP